MVQIQSGGSILFGCPKIKVGTEKNIEWQSQGMRETRGDTAPKPCTSTVFYHELKKIRKLEQYSVFVRWPKSKNYVSNDIYNRIQETRT